MWLSCAIFPGLQQDSPGGAARGANRIACLYLIRRAYGERNPRLNNRFEDDTRIQESVVTHIPG